MLLMIAFISFLAWLVILGLIIGLLFLVASIKLKGRKVKVYKAIPPTQFGSGSHCEFGRYLEGKSLIPISSVEEMCDWLRHCDYIEDSSQFQQNDIWQPPLDFEQQRRGDCED